MRRSDYKIEIHDYTGLVIGRSFDAGCYNQEVRHSLNVKPYLRGFIRELKRVLTLENPTLLVGDGKHTIPYYRSDRQIVGLSIWINDALIVKRRFSVYPFNPAARRSLELQQATNWIVLTIQECLWQQDCQKIWDDLTLINYLNCGYKAVNSFTKNQRHCLLKEAEGAK